MGQDDFIVDVDELIKKRERKPILERVGRGIQKVGGQIKESLRDTPEKRIEQLKLLKAQRKVLEQKRMIALEKAKIQRLQPKSTGPAFSEFGFGPVAKQAFPKKKKKKKKEDDIFFQDDMFRF